MPISFAAPPSPSGLCCDHPKLLSGCVKLRVVEVPRADFTDQPKVVNGASDFLASLWATRLLAVACTAASLCSVRVPTGWRGRNRSILKRTDSYRASSTIPISDASRVITSRECRTARKTALARSGSDGSRLWGSTLDVELSARTRVRVS